jgi:hypothetical protein
MNGHTLLNIVMKVEIHGNEENKLIRLKEWFEICAIFFRD